jgi:hypothetical protein
MIQNLSNFFIELSKSGYTDEELLPLINDAFSEYTKEDIKENVISNLLNPFVEVYLTREFKEDDNRESILENTIFQYFEKDIENYTIIKNHLLELSLYDKIIERDNINYFYLINMLLINYILHFNALIERRLVKEKSDTDTSSVSLSNSTTVKAIISKQYNAVKTTLVSMPNNEELKFRDNLYEEYLRNPHSASKIIHSINLLGGVKSFTDEQNEYIFNSRKVIDSAFPFKIKDIYKSANLLILIFFRSDSFWIKGLKTEKIISNNKLIEINEVLMENIFETRNKLNKDNVSQPIQVRTDYDLTPLYEFRNDSNIKIHPAFEDTKENQEYWNDITEYIKKKIPLKSDDI